MIVRIIRRDAAFPQRLSDDAAADGSSLVVPSLRGQSGRGVHFFGTSPEFWLSLQALYELRLVEARTGKAIRKLPTPKQLEGAHA